MDEGMNERTDSNRDETTLKQQREELRWQR